jgi:uncharacterized phage infection (PIP) family protein YhgE
MLIAVGLSVAFLTACAADAEQDPAAQEVAETASAEELRAWASDVCSAADELATTVTAVTDGLDVDLSQGLDQLPAIQEQVSANLDEVEARIEAVEDALAAVPDGSPGATAFAAEMEALVDSARASGQEAIDLLAEAGAAGDLLNAGLAAAGAVSAAQSAAADADAALQLLDSTRAETGSELGEAFSTAEGCR